MFRIPAQSAIGCKGKFYRSGQEVDLMKVLPKGDREAYLENGTLKPATEAPKAKKVSDGAPAQVASESGPDDGDD